MAMKTEHTTTEAYLEEGQVTPNLTARNSPSKSKLHDHKDGLQRYADAKPEFRNKDHFLQAEDGKLQVLRVQLAPNHRSSNNMATTWERPKQPNMIKVLWRGFRNAPRDIVRWTFNDSLKCKNSPLYTLPIILFFSVSTLVLRTRGLTFYPSSR